MFIILGVFFMIKKYIIFILSAFTISAGSFQASGVSQATPPRGWPPRVRYIPGNLIQYETEVTLPNGEKEIQTETQDFGQWQTSIEFINNEVGHGLVARNLPYIPKGAVIGVYTGRVRVVSSQVVRNLPYAMTTSTYDPDTRTFNHEDKKATAVQRVIDAEQMGNETRFCNHSNNPNAYFGKDPRNLRTVFVRTLRDIFPGEQITVDYGKEYWECRNQVPC